METPYYLCLHRKLNVIFFSKSPFFTFNIQISLISDFDLVPFFKRLYKKTVDSDGNDLSEYE